MIGSTCITWLNAATASPASLWPVEKRSWHPGNCRIAVVRNVEVIGEAAKRVSAESRGRLASLDWKAICGMRDVLIHDYIGVDLDEVWNVASSRMPELEAALDQYLCSENPGSALVPC